MNEAAQNALLKLLEEPPKGVYFFLLCESGSRLLPTVISRGILLRTEAFTEGKIDDYLMEHSKKAELMKRQKPEEYAFLLKNSGGSIGRALSILDGESKLSSSVYDSVMGLLSILRNPDKATLLQYENKIPDTREGYGEFLENLATAMRDILAHKYGADTLSFFGTHEEAEEFAFDFSADYLARKIDICLKHIEQNEYSVNLRIARMRLFEELWR
jgi:DNA polymerase-3 subunit delta'